MKSALFILTATAAFCLMLSCNRQANTDPSVNATRVTAVNPAVAHGNSGNGRLVSSEYSQPIGMDTANKMIASYLTAVGYPNYDTAVRSLSFDADTLRAYLKDSRITTVKFVLAHQLSWINANSANFGKNIGMKPGALTIIAVGLDDNGGVIRNTSNGVYEHALPCPFCNSEVDAYLH